MGSLGRENTITVDEGMVSHVVGVGDAILIRVEGEHPVREKIRGWSIPVDPWLHRQIQYPEEGDPMVEFFRIDGDQPLKTPPEPSLSKPVLPRMFHSTIASNEVRVLTPGRGHSSPEISGDGEAHVRSQGQTWGAEG